MRYRMLWIVVFVFVASWSHAQEFLPKETNVNLADLEAKFDQWRQSKDLETEKGWKYYARWLEFQIQRSTSQGAWPNTTSTLEVAVDLANKKQANSRTMNDWLPVGPAEFPYIPRSSLIRGMGRINTVAFHPTDANTLFVGVAQGGVWKSSDSGQSWTPLTDDLPILRISDIAIDNTNPDIMYICVGDYAYVGSALDTDGRKRNTHYGLGVYKSVNGGLSWNPTGLTFDQTEEDASLMRRVFIDPSNSDRLIAAGISGIYVSKDGGDSWNKKLDQVMADIEQDQTNPTTYYASSFKVIRLGIGESAVWKSVDNGETWTKLNVAIDPINAQRVELAIAPSNSQVIYALVCDQSGGLSGFYQSTDGGVSWVTKNSQPNILHWYSGTSSGGQGLYDLAIMVHPTDENTVYTGGVNMWGTDDGGDTWKRASYWLPSRGPSIHADHHQYKYNPSDQYYYACHDGGINRTKEIVLHDPEDFNNSSFQFETDWEDISAGMEITSFYRMDFSRVHQDDVIAGAQDNSTYIKRDSQWLNVVLGDGMECLFHPTNGNVIYTSTQGGRFNRSEDRGESFQGGLSNQISNTETGAWTTPFVQDPFNVDGLYAAFGNVWKSDDRGDSWLQLTDLDPMPGRDFILPAAALAVSVSDPGRFYVAKRYYPTIGSNSEFWTSSNAGLTMENITAGLPDSLYFSSCAIDDENAETIYVTCSGFADGLKVFKSENAGLTWENISFDLPNIPVNKIILSPLSNAIYIGTDVGVYVKSASLDEWQYFSQGMPNVIVTDLEIDEVNELLYASTFGRGIWKTDIAEISSTGEIAISPNQMNILPNPSKGQFMVELETQQEGQVNIQLFNIGGKLVMQQKRSIESGHNELAFDVNLPSGAYFLKLDNEEITRVKRLLIH